MVHAKHTDGHDTPTYYVKLEQPDEDVGQKLDAIRQAGMRDKKVVILTADHDGTGNGHGGIALAEMEKPFIIPRKGIRCVGKFEESMMQYDQADTIAYIFKLKVPQVWTGRPPRHVFR